MKSIVKYIKESKKEFDYEEERIFRKLDIHTELYHRGLKPNDLHELKWPELEDILGMSESKFNSLGDIRIAQADWANIEWGRLGAKQWKVKAYYIRISKKKYYKDAPYHDYVDCEIAIFDENDKPRIMEGYNKIFNCGGHGGSASKYHYFGPDEDEFKKTIPLVIKDHLN